MIRIALPYRDNSTDYFLRVRDLGWAVWLDSGRQAPHRGRFDIISAAPSRRLVSDADGCRCLERDAVRRYVSPWEALRQELQADTRTPDDDLPFSGGAIGYLGYDLGRQLEALCDNIADDLPLPTMVMGIYDWGLVQDHQRQRCQLVFDPSLPAERRALIHATLTSTSAASTASFQVGQFHSNTSRADYLARVARIRQYIAAGDCYQVNFAQRFSADFQGDPLAAYLTLRERLPSPYSAYQETEYGCVLSLSPEQFLQSREQRVTTRPIKGTCPRGGTPTEDRALADALLQSSKNKAENLMIVDLLRNDLSKVCDRVATPHLFALESYANVHHLVSTVTGELRPGVDAIELLRACFPGGSITGAPKIRAMEIIEELESSRRSVYCGSMAYIDRSGRMDSSIAIRTLLAASGRIHAWGGGGIVHDSDPAEEYQESLTKIGLLLDTLSGQRPS